MVPLNSASHKSLVYLLSCTRTHTHTLKAYTHIACQLSDALCRSTTFVYEFIYSNRCVILIGSAILSFCLYDVCLLIIIIPFSELASNNEHT